MLLPSLLRKAAVLAILVGLLACASETLVTPLPEATEFPPLPALPTAAAPTPASGPVAPEDLFQPVERLDLSGMDTGDDAGSGLLLEESPDLDLLFCDEMLREMLVFQKWAVDAAGVNQVVAEVQAQQEGCGAEVWNPVADDGQFVSLKFEERWSLQLSDLAFVADTGGCWLTDITGAYEGGYLVDGHLDAFGLDARVDGAVVPAGLREEDEFLELVVSRAAGLVSEYSGRDVGNNILVYWSARPGERTAGRARCWLYLAEEGVWYANDLAEDYGGSLGTLEYAGEGSVSGWWEVNGSPSVVYLEGPGDGARLRVAGFSAGGGWQFLAAGVGEETIFVSEDPEVAAVTLDGYVVGVAPGQARIRAVNSGPDVSTFYTVLVGDGESPSPRIDPERAPVIDWAGSRLILNQFLVWLDDEAGEEDLDELEELVDGRVYLVAGGRRTGGSTNEVTAEEGAVLSVLPVAVGSGDVLGVVVTEASTARESLADRELIRLSDPVRWVYPRFYPARSEPPSVAQPAVLEAGPPPPVDPARVALVGGGLGVVLNRMLVDLAPGTDLAEAAGLADLVGGRAFPGPEGGDQLLIVHDFNGLEMGAMLADLLRADPLVLDVRSEEVALGDLDFAPPAGSERDPFPVVSGFLTHPTRDQEYLQGQYLVVLEPGYGYADALALAQEYGGWVAHSLASYSLYVFHMPYHNFLQVETGFTGLSFDRRTELARLMPARHDERVIVNYGGSEHLCDLALLDRLTRDERAMSRETVNDNVLQVQREWGDVCASGVWSPWADDRGYVALPFAEWGAAGVNGIEEIDASGGCWKSDHAGWDNNGRLLASGEDASGYGVMVGEGIVPAGLREGGVFGAPAQGHTGEDGADNALIYWSPDPVRRPWAGSACWLYLADTDSWSWSN